MMIMTIKKTIKQNLKTLWLKLMYFCNNDPNKFQFILTFHYSPYITSLTKEQIETQTENMLETYRRGMEQQKIKEIPFELAIDYFWGNITSTMNYFRKYPQNNNKENLDLAFELFWDGISR